MRDAVDLVAPVDVRIDLLHRGVAACGETLRHRNRYRVVAAENQWHGAGGGDLGDGLASGSTVARTVVQVAAQISAIAHRAAAEGRSNEVEVELLGTGAVPTESSAQRSRGRGRVAGDARLLRRAVPGTEDDHIGVHAREVCGEGRIAERALGLFARKRGQIASLTALPRASARLQCSAKHTATRRLLWRRAENDGPASREEGGMIRTRAECIESIRDDRKVWIEGQRVNDVATHPAFEPLVDVRARNLRHGAPPFAHFSAVYMNFYFDQPLRFVKRAAGLSDRVMRQG